MSLDKIIEEHKKIFGVGLGIELADYFVNGLYKKLAANNESEILSKGSEVFYNLAKNVYGPILCHFVNCALESYNKSKKEGKILFLARDSIPLYHIAKTLISDSPIEKNLDILYLTRKLTGEADEIAGFKSRDINGEMKEYLSEINADDLLVDMGLYGTLYNKSCNEKWWKNNPHILFLYSKNPNILGFLNMIYSKISGNINNSINIQNFNEIGNKIVDGCECVNPQLFWSPGKFIINSGRFVPKLEKIEDRFIEQWHYASIDGYKDAAKDFIKEKENIIILLLKIQEFSEQAKGGNWTGVLPHITSEWSLKDRFLSNSPEYKKKTGKSGWNLGLAKPLGTEDIKYFTRELDKIQ